MNAYSIAGTGRAASKPANTAATTPAIRLSCRSSNIVKSKEAAAKGIVKLQTDESLKGSRVLCEAIALATSNPSRISADSKRMADPTRAKARAGETIKSTLTVGY